MKVRIHTAIVERASTLGDFPEVELPDDAVIVRVAQGTYVMVVTYYRVTLGPRAAV